jgi:alpha-glucoside transport system substrate-binding protein
MKKSMMFMVMVTAALGTVFAGGSSDKAAASSTGGKKTINFLAVWGGQEADVFKAMVKPFEERTGIKVELEATRDLDAVITTRVEAGTPPDVAGLPGPGKLVELAKAGKLVDLSKVLDMKEFDKNYSAGWKQLGTVDGKLYRIFTKAAIKGLVWYNPKTFKAAGVTPPTNNWTWDQMIQYSKQAIDKGLAPWSIGVESGAASGWVGTDWLENIFLHVNGPDLYRQWYEGKLAWTSPEVRKAWEIWGQIIADPKKIYGGSNYVNSTNFGSAPEPLFSQPPKALFHEQASFIQSFITKQFPTLKLVEDFDFVTFPTIDPKYSKAVEGAADVIGVFNNTPEVREFVNYLASAEAQAFWAAGTGALATNRNVSLVFYPDALTKRAADIMNKSDIVVFDASDMMKPEMNNAFWSAVVSYIENPKNLDSILQELEKVRLDAYK